MAETKKKTTRKKTKKVTKKAARKVAAKKPSYKLLATASDECLALWKKKTSELEALMKSGSQPTPQQLDGYRFRGLNVGFGPKLLGIQKFIKCFFMKDYGYGAMMTGNNFVVKQNAAQAEYITVQKKGRDKVQGYYLVENASGNERWNEYPNAALLHYGRGNNAWWDPAAKLRDYLVQPYSDNPNLLLGKAYFSVGPFKIKGGYFILERLSKL